MTDHVKEELDVVQIAIKSTTATQKPDKLTMASTDHGTRTGLRISNAIRFPVAFPCARLFDVIAVTLQQPLELHFVYQKEKMRVLRVIAGEV